MEGGDDQVMATIDDKIVSMSFESSKFENGVNKTISALDRLKASLKSTDGKSLRDLDAASKQVNLGHIAQGVDSIKQKLGFLSVAALAVFAQIAQRAVAAATQMIKAFTIDPIISGLKEYETNLNAVQTVLANTKAAGTTLKDVNKALYELNVYSDKTIYNFSEMARNIGTFTAAGVDLKTATAAIKGIANLAALSGSNSQQAATAMYQLSQAISAGRVSLQDWNSVVNAGMGGTVFQRALAQTAVAMGKLPESAVKLVGPMKNVSIHGQAFRQSIMAAPGKQSWLTSDVLTAALKEFTGDMTDAELAAMGFNKAQIKAIQLQAKTAMEAATKVKTLTQVIDVAKETAQSGWSQTWQYIFGDFGEARKTFTDLSNAINGFINANSKARNKVLADWKELGGRTVLIKAISTMFENLGKTLAPIKEAFRDIFPAKTGKDLYNLTVRFSAFTQSLKPSAETVENLHRTFAGLFAAFDITKQIMGGIISVFAHLFGVIFSGAGSFLEFTAGVGDWIVALDKALRKGKGLEQFFTGLGTLLAIPLHVLRQLASAIGSLFDDFSPGEFSVEMDGITKSAIPFQKIISAIAEAVQGLGSAIANAVNNINWDTVLAVINTGLFAGLVLLIRKFIGGSTLEGLFKVMGGSFGKQFGGGVLQNLGKSLGSLSGALQSYQQNLKAKTLKEIAIAVALLAASLVAMSLVNPKNLSNALGAMTLAFGELLGSMVILDKLLKAGAAVKLPLIATSLIALAVALDLLSLAVLALSRLSWEEILKGLTGVAALLGILAVATGPLSKNAGGMIRSSLSIIAIAAAMKIFASAMADFGALSWQSIAKGLVSVGIGLGLMAAGARAMPGGMVLKGAGLVVMAAGLKLLADAVGQFGGLNWTVLGRGLAGVAGSLVIIAGAMRLMPKNMVITAAGLMLVALSLGKIVDAVARLGGMSLEKLAKGLFSLAGALVVLAIGLHAMSGAVAGAAALTIAAAGLSLLVPALTSLGKQSWSSIIKGLVSLAAGLALVAAAGILLSSAVPAMIGLGAALVLIGGGLALAGAGIAAIGIGLSAIAASGATAIAILIQALIDFSEAIPKFVSNLVLGLLAMVQKLAEVAPQFVAALVKILNALLNVTIQSAPKFAQAFFVLLMAALNELEKNAPRIIQAGMNILVSLLKGIAANIGRVVTQAANVVTNFLNGVAKNAVRIVTAGAQVIIRFVQGIANNVGKLVAAGANVIVQFLQGIANNVGRIITAGTNIIIKFIQGVAQNGVRLANAAGQAIVTFLNGLARAIERYTPQIMEAGARIGIALVKGLIKGITDMTGQALSTAKSFAGKVLGALGDAIKFWSPSHENVLMGIGLVEGLMVGMMQDSPAIQAATALGTGVIAALNDVLQTGSPSAVTKQIGRWVVQGFRDGLLGSKEDINQAFADLTGKINDAIRDVRQTIAQEKAKIRELEKDKHRTPAESKELEAEQKALEQNEAVLKRLIAAHKELPKALKAEKAELIGYANQYAAVTEQLDAANEALQEAIQTRDQAKAGYTEEYGALPELPDAEGATDMVGVYEQSLTDQIAATAKYNETLQQLRALGLDDKTYQMLLDKGVGGQAFATALLAGGQAAVTAVNTLDSQLATESNTLATNASTNLYQAGVNAAQGLVDGLTAQQSAIKDAMEALATEMIKAIKKKLKIKSPSAIFQEMGNLSADGMAKGLMDGARTVKAAVGNMADTALESMRRDLKGMSDLVMQGIDTNPTIQPILDLTRLKNAGRDINSALGGPMSTVALRTAADISAAQAAALASTEAAPAGSIVNFEQNNYSPEALSDVEIYRQTRNQLSLLRLKTSLVPV
jgi:tape measure domain-containing protein